MCGYDDHVSLSQRNITANIRMTGLEGRTLPIPGTTSFATVLHAFEHVQTHLSVSYRFSPEVNERRGSSPPNVLSRWY